MQFTVKNCMKPGFRVQLSADLQPQLRAIALSFLARGKPTSLSKRETLLSILSNNFPKIEYRTLAKNKLRTFAATSIVKSISARSTLDNALNQTPRRIALVLTLIKLALQREMQPQGRRSGPIVNHTLNSFNARQSKVQLCKHLFSATQDIKLAKRARPRSQQKFTRSQIHASLPATFIEITADATARAYPATLETKLWN
jgi:DNA gyrase/topoisomerase IV subunit B